MERGCSHTSSTTSAAIASPSTRIRPVPIALPVPISHAWPDQRNRGGACIGPLLVIDAHTRPGRRIIYEGEIGCCTQMAARYNTLTMQGNLARAGCKSARIPASRIRDMCPL